jgi:inosine-uridine nucleoside N-ribohydrolase
MIRAPLPALCLTALLALAVREIRAEDELVIYDNDWNAPGSYVGQAAIMPLMTSPRVKLIGLTTVTGDCWRDEGRSSLLRYLEEIYGFVYWKGAWNDPARFPKAHPTDPYLIPPTVDGPPHLAVQPGTAAAFMIAQVHAHPHQVTIFEGGPMTNLALAIGLDPEFARLAKRLVFQGGVTGQIQSFDGFHSDFNLVFDPEAAHITLCAPWTKIICFAEVSDPYVYDPAFFARIHAHPSPAGDYLGRNSGIGLPLWEELGAAIIADPTLITKTVDVTMDVDIDHGMSYGRTTVGSVEAKPRLGVGTVTIIQAVDGKRFLDAYVASVQTDLTKR